MTNEKNMHVNTENQQEEVSLPRSGDENPPPPPNPPTPPSGDGNTGGTTSEIKPGEGNGIQVPDSTVNN